MRYAQNLAAGHGLVFNIGEHPLEAYSNFLFVLLESLLQMIGYSSVVSVKIISYVFGVGIILSLLFMGNKVLGRKHSKEIGFVQILVASSTPFIIWTVGGLETIQFTFTIVAALTAYLYAEKATSSKSKSRWYFTGDILAFLVMLSRPEGLLFTLGAVVYRLLNKSYKNALFITFLIIIYFIWKWLYFGDMMPTPYYAKAHHIDFLGGIRRFIEFLKININIIYIFIFPALYSMIVANFRNKKFSLELFTALFITIYLLYILSLGYNVAMDDAYRYYVPFVVLGAIAFLFYFKNNQINLSKQTFILLVLILITFRITDIYTAWTRDLNWSALSYRISGNGVAKGLKNGHIALGKWLKKNADKNAIIVVHDAGAIPYFSHLKTIDVWSLCDKTMVNLNSMYRYAKTEEDKKEIAHQKLKYLLKQNPDYIIQDKGIITKTQYIKNYHLLPMTYPYMPWYKLRIYEKNK